MKATILDLRHKMKEIISPLDRYEPVTLTNRGKTKGAIMPVQPCVDSVKFSANHPAFGLWKD